MSEMNPTDPSFIDPLQSLIADFLDAESKGEPIDRAKWLAEHASHADSLKEFLANHDRMKRSAQIVPDDVTLPPDSHTHNDATLPLDGASSVKSHEASVGDRLRYFGDYELLEEIARGGMGVVYKAKQINLNRIVALKMILAGQLASEQEVQRFRTEAEAAANLDHPNIVPIHEIGQHDRQQYFTMKLIEGGSLSQAKEDYRQQPPLQRQRWIASLMLKVARAVQHAHERGILHRDLKPSNILVDQSSEPHVTDFGLAKKVTADSDLTHTGAILGTPAYMAPEQARGDKSLTIACDIYSLGAILYELLVGHVAFPAATPLETILSVLDKEPVRPSSIDFSINRDLETICLKCMEKSPLSRYRSAEELAKDLERWLASKPIHARSIGLLERTGKWVRRNPVVASLLGATLLCLLLGLALGTVFGFTVKDYMALVRLPPSPEDYEVPRFALNQWEYPAATFVASSEAQDGTLTLRTYSTTDPIALVWKHYAQLAGVENVSMEFAPGTMGGGNLYNQNTNQYGTAGGVRAIAYHTGDIRRDAVQTAIINLVHHPGFSLTIVLSSAKDEGKTYITIFELDLPQ